MRSAPAAWVLAMAVLFVACGLIGWLVSKRHRGRPSLARDTDADTHLRSFDTTAVRGSVNESLRALHGEANDEH